MSNSERIHHVGAAVFGRCKIVYGAAAILMAAHPASAAGIPDADSFAAAALVAGLVLIILVLNAIFAVWVARDAKRRGAQRPVGWILAALFFGAAGLCFYFIFRPRNKPSQPD